MTLAEIEARTPYSSNFVIRRTGRPSEAEIFADGTPIASLKRTEAPSSSYSLEGRDGTAWSLTPQVRGEVRPFSMTVTRVRSSRRQSPRASNSMPVLTIVDHLFVYRRKFYMLGCLPVGMNPSSILTGRKYICRLDNFPHSGIFRVDHGTMSRLRRLRGIPVGELDGLGFSGHTVKLATELREIGLPLAVSSYLLYATA